MSCKKSCCQAQSSPTHVFDRSAVADTSAGRHNAAQKSRTISFAVHAPHIHTSNRRRKPRYQSEESFTHLHGSPARANYTIIAEQRQVPQAEPLCAVERCMSYN